MTITLVMHVMIIKNTGNPLPTMVSIRLAVFHPNLRGRVNRKVSGSRSIRPR